MAQRAGRVFCLKLHTGVSSRKLCSCHRFHVQADVPSVQDCECLSSLTGLTSSDSQRDQLPPAVDPHGSIAFWYNMNAPGQSVIQQSPLHILQTCSSPSPLLNYEGPQAVMEDSPETPPPSHQGKCSNVLELHISDVLTTTSIRALYL
jgi:hypothetical protein